MWCNFTTQIRGALSVSPICKFCPTVGGFFADFGTFKIYNFGITQDIVNLKQLLEKYVGLHYGIFVYGRPSRGTSVPHLVMVALCNRADHYIFAL